MIRKFSILTVIILLFLLYPNPYTLTPLIFAQTCPTQATNPRVQEGLISTLDISSSNNKFGNSTSQCIVSSQAAFAPYKVPTYDDLKSIYFDQAKSSVGITKTTLTGDQTQSNIPMTTGTDHLYYIKTDPTSTSPDGNLTITDNIAGSQTGVILVDGKLSIGPIPSKKLTTGAIVGLVFVVKGDVIIDQSITQIDAVIISSGKIYTAVNINSGSVTCSHNSPVTTVQLVVNGSLVSLDPNKPIEFCRSLGAGNNTTAAEQINSQPKYLVILRNLMSDTMQKWSEIQ